MSERGVHQGDPCGPLFFALTLDTLAAELSSGIAVRRDSEDIVSSV